jgi:SAM-dependent methyltransferase
VGGEASYSPEVIAKVARELGLPPTSTVLEPAAGTGCLARVLASTFGQVIAMAPSEVSLAHLREELPSVQATSGTVEAIPVPERSVDAVFLSDAFFASDAFHALPAPRVYAELARVLKRGGRLVVVRQHAFWPEPYDAALAALVASPHQHSRGNDDWKLTIEDTRVFEALSQIVVEDERGISPQDFVNLVASWGWIADLPVQEGSAILVAVRELLGDHSIVTMRYRTEIYWTSVA